MNETTKRIFLLAAIVFAAAVAAVFSAVIIAAPHKGRIGDVNDVLADADFRLAVLERGSRRITLSDNDEASELIMLFDSGVWRYADKSSSLSYRIKLYSLKDTVTVIYLYENGKIQMGNNYYESDVGAALYDYVDGMFEDA